MNDHTKLQIAKVMHEAASAAMATMVGHPFGHVPEGGSFEENKESALDALDEAIENDFIPPATDDPKLRVLMSVGYTVAKEMTDILS